MMTLLLGLSSQDQRYVSSLPPPLTLLQILTHTHTQVDLVEIKKAFLNLYHKTLYKMIEGDTSGDYRRLLQAVVGSAV